MKKIIWPVLIVDDEYPDVESLERVLDTTGSQIYKSEKYILPNRIRQYAANPEDAIQQMIEVMNKNQRYSAVVCDNRMDDGEGEGIFGEDFLRIIQGKPGYALTRYRQDTNVDLNQFHSFDEMFDYFGRSSCSQDTAEFMRDSFEKIGLYQGFVEYFYGHNSPNMKTILFCGSPEEVKNHGVEEVVKIRKCNGCEKRVISELSDVLPWDYLHRSYEFDDIIAPKNHPNQRTFKPSPIDKKKMELRKLKKLK